MKYIPLIILFFSLFSSCSDNKVEKPSFSKCTVTISETKFGKTSFLLCSHFREPIDTVFFDKKLILNGTFENYENEQLTIFNFSGINKKFINDLILDDLEIKISEDKIKSIKVKGINSSIFFESYYIGKNKDNTQYIIAINGKELAQNELFAFSDNEFSMQLNMILTINIK